MVVEASNVIPFRDLDAESRGYLRTLGASISSRLSGPLGFDQLDAYYRGDHGQRFAGTKYRELFARLFERYAENFCGLVVNAVEERLDVEGFRFPQVDDVGGADKDAWRIWQDNQLDAGSQIAHKEALIKGVVYVLVSPFPQDRIGPDRRSPRITIEDPCETIIEYAPGTRERVVGMKRWDDYDAKLTYATLYFRDRIEKWQAPLLGSTQYRDVGGRFLSYAETAQNWVPKDTPGEPWPLRHNLGIVPLVPLVNRPRLRGEGESEIAAIIPIQDAINKLATDELVAAEASAFRQKWATGVEIPIDPDTKRPVAAWQPDIERIMSTAAPDARFGNFEATDLNVYVQALDQKVQSIASISQTPYHYFLRQGGQPPSGESLKSSETGLVRKTRRKTRHFGEGWEEVIRIAFRSLDDARSEILDSETIWANPESLTEAEHTDALIKQRALRVPYRELWKSLGFTPTQIETFDELLKAEGDWLDGTLAERDATLGKGDQSGPGAAADGGGNGFKVTRDANGKVAGLERLP